MMRLRACGGALLRVFAVLAVVLLGIPEQCKGLAPRVRAPEAPGFVARGRTSWSHCPRGDCCHHQRQRRRPMAMALGAVGLWQGYLGLLATAPLPTKAATAAVIIGGGDAAAQWIEGRRAAEPKGIDLPRVGRWAAFGLLLQVRTADRDRRKRLSMAPGFERRLRVLGGLGLRVGASGKACKQ